MPRTKATATKDASEESKTVKRTRTQEVIKDDESGLPEASENAAALVSNEGMEDVFRTDTKAVEQAGGVQEEALVGEIEDVIAEDDEPNPDDIIERSTAFYAHKTLLASKEKRSELRRSEHIVTENATDKIRNAVTDREEEKQDLVGSAMSGRVLRGEIVGMRHSDPDDPQSFLLADVKYKTGRFVVSIPSFLLFDYDENEYSGDRGARMLEERVMQRIGAEIRFIVRQVDQRNGIAYADSLEAQAHDAYRYYLARWRGSDHARVSEGSIVQARVIAVGRTFIIVDALGAEARIANSDLSYMRFSDAREIYEVNQKVNIRIKSISSEVVTKRKTNKYTLVKLEASVSGAGEDRRKEIFDQLQIGALRAATITHIDDKSNIFCNLQDEIDCVCKYPQFGRQPAEGQKWTIRITMKDPEKLHIFGILVR